MHHSPANLQTRGNILALIYVCCLWNLPNSWRTCGLLCKGGFCFYFMKRTKYANHLYTKPPPHTYCFLFGDVFFSFLTDFQQTYIFSSWIYFSWKLVSFCVILNAWPSYSTYYLYLWLSKWTLIVRITSLGGWDWMVFKVLLCDFSYNKRRCKHLMQYVRNQQIAPTDR